MKLSRILPLVVGSAAAGILVSSSGSPAQALTWTATNITFVDGGTLVGSFDYSNNTYSNINLTLTGPAILGASGTTTDPEVGIEGTITFTDANLVSAFGDEVILSNVGGGSGVLFNGDTFLRMFLTDILLYNTTPSIPGIYTVDNVFEYGVNDGVAGVSGVGSFEAVVGAPEAVPFDIPGGATIPTVGSLFALGLMRKVKKKMALKTIKSATSY